jgi:hypothetical protein
MRLIAPTFIGIIFLNLVLSGPNIAHDRTLTLGISRGLFSAHLFPLAFSPRSDRNNPWNPEIGMRYYGDGSLAYDPGECTEPGIGCEVAP